MSRFFKHNAAGCWFFITLIATCIIIVVVGLTFQMDSSRLQLLEAADFSQGWQIERAGSWDELTSMDNDGILHIKEPIRIRCTLPNNLATADTMCFMNQNISIRAYINNTCFYEYGHHEVVPFGSFFGNSWSLISLPEDAQGRALILELEAPTGGGMLSKPQLDSRGTIILSILVESFPRILGCLLLLLIGCAEILYWVYCKRKKHERGNTDLFFGVFTLLAMIWIATDGLISLFVIGNRALNFNLSIYSFMLLVPIFALYLRELLGKYHKLLNSICIGLCLYILLRMVLSVTNVLEIYKLLFLYHAFIAAFMVLVIYLCYKKRHSQEARTVLTGAIVLAICGAMSFFLFYMSNLYGINYDLYGLVFLLGLILFCVFLAIGRVFSYLHTSRKAIRAEYFERRAYTDILTGLGNFAACEQLLSIYETEPIALSIIMFDLNNLKKTNDAFGHNIGDGLLQATAACMKKAFEPQGKAFRNGGDEFVVILPQMDERDVQQAIASFNKELASYNEQTEYPIDIACGVATRNDDSSLGAHELMRLADTNMYIDKRQKKGHNE